MVYYPCRKALGVAGTAAPDTTWRHEQNLPVVTLIPTDLFNRVVSALGQAIARDKPGDGDKGTQVPTCRKASPTENSSSRFCLSARGQLQRVWQDRGRRYIAGPLTRKRGRKHDGSAVRVPQEQVLHLSAGGSSNRKEGAKGQKDVRKTCRAANSGPCPKDRDGKCTPRSPQASTQW